MSDSPLTPAGDGRGPGGRFVPGNHAGKGNPHARRVQQIRAALMRAIKPADIAIAVTELMKQAKTGDRFALAEILDRTLGRPVPSDLEERLTRLEISLQEKHQ